MKLKTADIIPLVVRYAAQHVGARFDPSDTAAIAAASNPRLWKRVHKAKVARLMATDDQGNKLPLDFGWEFIDTIQDAQITDDCIYRHFINDILGDGLDPVVITDPTDTQILRLCWHCD
jgi:hypothetical protein